MDWKTTEEVYAELLDAEDAAAMALNMASKAEAQGRAQMRLAEEKYEEQRWKLNEVRELKAELLKRANATKEKANDARTGD